jgi:hypothetical protein
MFFLALPDPIRADCHRSAIKANESVSSKDKDVTT